MVPKRDAADTSVLGLNSHSAFANYSHFLLYRLNAQRHIDAHGRRDHHLNLDHGSARIRTKQLIKLQQLSPLESFLCHHCSKSTQSSPFARGPEHQTFLEVLGRRQ